MKRLLGLLALVIIPSLLTIPSGAAAPSAEPQARVAVVTVTDIAARARRVIGLANRNRWTELAAIATPDMVTFLRDRDRWVVDTPSCRKSTASKPGDTVYACRITEYEYEPWAARNGWWIYFRKVDGHWLTVNKRLATSSYGYGTERNLDARTTKLLDLAWNENWAALKVYASSAFVESAKGAIAELKAEGRTDPTGWGECHRVKPAYVDTFGQFACGWLVVAWGDIITRVVYRNESGSWLATGPVVVQDDEF